MHNDDDMIERFLEGQTSNEENEALFSALASDNMLQAEFRTSVGIRRTFEHEAAIIKAPPAVLDSLMASATASGLIPPAPVVTAPAAGSISGGIIKFFILLGAMVIGAALYPVLFRNDEATTGRRPATAQGTGEPSMNRGVGTTPGDASASNDGQHLATPHGAVASRTTSPTAVMTDGEPVRSSTTTVIPERPAHRSSSARTTTSSREPAVSNVTTLPIQPASTDVATTATDVESEEAPISPSTPIATFESTAPDVDSQNATAEPIALSDDTSVDDFSRFEFRFHSQAFGRDIGGYIDGVSPWANFGGELGYRFDDISSAGLGFYHVVMPKDTAIFMRWWGAYYRATPDIGLPFQLRPYLQATVGGCERGFVMAPSIGLTMPVGMFSLSLGADVTALALNAGDSIVSFTARPAMRFAVSITF